MNHNRLTHLPFFHDNESNDSTPFATPRESWMRLSAGDERAESFESFLRVLLIMSVLCSVLICALRLSPASDTQDGLRLAMPSCHLPQVVEHATASTVQAVLR